MSAFGVQAMRFHGATNRTSLTTELVHDNFRPLRHAGETTLDEVDLCFDCRQVVLRAALQHESPTQLRQVGNLRHVEPDILRQHIAECGHDLVGRPSLTLKIDDVRLHKHRAAVPKTRHRFSAEGNLGKLFHRIPERLRRTLQEISVTGRTLRVEFEILHLTVLQHNQLDVLSPDIHDHVGVRIEMQSRLGVRDRFHQRHIGP